jgi:uncharacterized membrane protein YsdA (DUF1294 family)/cold shock CspA family protein
MPLKGRVREWRDEKGFGFIEPMLPGPAVFVHINSFKRPGLRPQVGDLLVYEVGMDANGRTRAERVEFSLASKPPSGIRTPSARRPWAIPLAVISLSGIGAASAAGKVPVIIASTYLVMSLITYVLYVWDKVSARRGRWRTQESTLLLAGLLGGWPGGLIAQETTRHKTAKASFQAAFWGALLINLTVFCWLFINDFSLPGSA